MFGMSSEDFWENDPKLYWAYRTFYFKKKEMQYEEMLYNAWLNGSMDYMAVAYGVNNCFSKQKVNYPSFEEINKLKVNKKQENLTTKDIDTVAQEQFNYWARK